eukprot:Blabericola_migrator_1__1690@NODE_1455_length_4516_cov_9_046527_g961_i0_p1_GENE_NODE_1455_length_4516_cov_9_046527_g961_i0NODE_1455_length_4516_cov_9_046527_g961_i0_p1_ORF_typecomplete_len207_score30_31Apolipoprotein/PF01442_18/0_0013Synuclein/PF01387_17/0_046Gemini_mov/PF01708_16/0_41_NODE_1455_length_4516_cov_9_046527_g961_i038204440
MRSVEGKPSKKSACELDLLTVLVCPITFPTPSTLLHVLNATQEQVTESASGLAERVTESASGLAEAGLEFFNSINSSATENLTETTEHFTPHQVNYGIKPRDDAWRHLVLCVGAIVVGVGFAYHQLRNRDVLSRSTERDSIPLQGNAVPSTSSYLEPPPPYEAPPSYDSWLNIANNSIEPSTVVDLSSLLRPLSEPTDTSLSQSNP